MYNFSTKQDFEGTSRENPQDLKPTLFQNQFKTLFGAAYQKLTIGESIAKDVLGQGFRTSISGSSVELTRKA